MNEHESFCLAGFPLKSCRITSYKDFCERKPHKKLCTSAIKYLTWGPRDVKYT